MISGYPSATLSNGTSDNQYFKDFMHLKPHERLKHIEAISNYSVAKLQSVELNSFSDLERLSDDQLDRIINQTIDIINNRIPVIQRALK